MHKEPRATRVFLLASRSPRLGDRCRYPAMRMFWKSSLLTSSIAAIATLYIVLTGIENPGPSLLAVALVGSVVIIIMVGLYLAFGAIAFALRSHRILSRILFAIILAVAMSAVICLYVENEAWLNRDKSREGQRMVPFLIGMAEWISAVFTTAILLPLFLISKKASEGTTTKTNA